MIPSLSGVYKIWLKCPCSSVTMTSLSHVIPFFHPPVSTLKYPIRGRRTHRIFQSNTVAPPELLSLGLIWLEHLCKIYIQNVKYVITKLWYGLSSSHVHVHVHVCGMMQIYIKCMHQSDLRSKGIAYLSTARRFTLEFWHLPPEHVTFSSTLPNIKLAKMLNSFPFQVYLNIYGLQKCSIHNVRSSPHTIHPLAILDIVTNRKLVVLNAFWDHTWKKYKQPCWHHLTKLSLFLCKKTINRKFLNVHFGRLFIHIAPAGGLKSAN